MQRRFAGIFRPLVAVPVLLVLALAFGAALAQNGDEKSGFVRFLENGLSTPDRKVSLDGVEDIFSWHPKIARITVSDRGGAWLELDGVEVVWTRSALLQRRLDIDVLRAAKVSMSRRPMPLEGASDESGMSGPPLEIVIENIALPLVVLDAPVLGAAAELSTAGSARLSEAAFAGKLTVERQDRAGSLSADLAFDPAKSILTANIRLSEPKNGLMAQLMRLRGQPAIDLSVVGKGPLDQWQANLDLQADGRRVISGAMSITSTDAGHRLLAKLAAALGSLVPQEYAALVSGESGIDLEAVHRDDGSIAINTAELHSEGLDLSASGLLDADLVPQLAKFSLSLGRAGRVELPFLPGGLSVASLKADAELSAGGAAPWRIEISAEGTQGSFGRVAGLALNAIGEARNLAEPEARATAFTLDGSAEGIAAADQALRDAVGSTLRLSGAGSWSAGKAVSLDNLQLTLGGASASFSGTATADELSGSFAAAVGDLTRFAALAGRPLAGQVEMKAEGTASRDGTFDLNLDGESTDLALGIAALDPILRGETKIAGGVARRDGGLKFDALKISNGRATADVDGSYADPAIDLTVAATISDLALVAPRTSGAARLNAKLSGTRSAPQVVADATGDNVVLMERKLTGAKAHFSGTIAGPDTSGEVEIAGTLGDAPVRGAATLSAGANGARVLKDLSVSVGLSRVAGDLTLGADGLLAGSVTVISPDLSKVAPLFLVDARGMLHGELRLSSEGGAQSAEFSGTATDIVYENVSLDSADIKGTARDLFRAPLIDGDFLLHNMRAGGLTIVSATGTAARQGTSTLMSIDAKLADGSAKMQGSFGPSSTGVSIALQSFTYKRPGVDLALASPTTIAVAGGSARFNQTTLRTGGGSVVLSGQVGANIDLTANLNAVPVALANSFKPDLGAEGTVSGTVTAKGAAADPSATFKIVFANASVTASRNAGLGPLAISADGTLAGKTLNLRSHTSGAGNLSIDGAGTIGTASGAPLNLKIAGTVPLALGNARLAARGAALQGALKLDVAVSGTAAAPKFSGRITSEGGGFVDPETGIVLKDLRLAATVSGDRIVIEQLNATSGGGTVSAVGSVGLDPNGGFPVELAIKVHQARYVDGTLVASRFDADLKLAGSFMEGPLLSGTVFLDRTEVTVPERLPRDSVAVNVEHIAPPPSVKQTLASARQPDARGKDKGPKPAGMRLDVTVNAPKQIFVRGRGLDTEFGGKVQLSGPVSAVTAAGGFQLVRGRLDILTQRISFNRGIITFAGDLDPILDFTGSTKSGDTTITVTVSGRASDPQVTFSSTPELPQDEILARLIFQKGIGELSPLQVARLAAAVSELTGGQGGVLSRLRAVTGLDDIDIVTDEKGQTAVAAGRYVTENVYIGVQQGAGSKSSKVTIDLDVTKDVKARAGMGSDGGSSLGIFFEKEY